MPRPRPDPIAQPHNAIVDYAFSQREHAVGLLQAVLPSDIVSAAQWPTLTLINRSFVDRALRHRYLDLLFSVRMGSGLLHLYTLVEHQRHVEPLMMLRGGGYMMRAWEHVVREDPTRKTLPPMMLIVIHHSPTGWTAATSFQDLIEADEPARSAIMPYTPHFGMKLVDLSGGLAAVLVNRALTAFGQVVLWALSVAGDDARFEKELAFMSGAIDAMLRHRDGGDALRALLGYLLATHAPVGAAKIVGMVETAVSARQRKVVMDVLDVFRKEGRAEGRTEGRAEGRTEGRAEGRAKTLLELLAARFGPVPSDVKAKILAAKEPTLARWSLRVLTAPTREAVLGSKTKAPAPRPASRKRARAS